MSEQQQVFFALSEPSRRKVLETLAARGEMSASEICAEFQVTPQDISKHLRVLRESGLVVVERRAQQRIYSVNADTILEWRIGLDRWRIALTHWTRF